MSEIFLTVVNMSISAGWLVLVVLLLRLLLKKAPKWITVLLWGIVAVRLVCPLSFESVLSLIPSAQTINPEFSLNTPAIDSGVAIIDNAINPILSEATITVQPEKDINLFKFIVPYLAGVWLAGIVALLIYTLVSYLKVKNRIGTAVLLRDNIYQSENVVSPFVLGIIKPKIYLPFCMNEQDMQHVIAHENAHIRRKDHLWKPLGFLVLTLHWFNPLMWLGYVLLCRDIELACDEKVVKELSTEQKADYSQALLTCSVNRRMIAACPLAFGEVGVKDRVKSVLNYKKPAFWIIIVAIALSIIVGVCFLTNPMSTTLDDELVVFIDTQIAEQNYSKEHTGDNFITVSYEVLGVDKSANETTVYMWVLYEEYSFEDGKIKLETGSHIPTAITAKQTGNRGHYELVEYWTPRDGSFYADDIRGKFPLHLHSKALDPQRYIDKQKEFCQKSAEEYFRKEAEKQADEQSKLLEQLKETHPHFFNIPTEGGLTVYVWEWSPGIFQCHLANTQIDAQKGESFVYSVGYATVEEMKAILTTYEIAQADITVKAVVNPLSGYYRDIDEEFQREVEELFGFYIYDISKIPNLFVVYEGRATKAVMGTTSWSYDMGDGTWQGINGDSSHPLAMLDHLLSNAITVDQTTSPISYVELKFNIVPDAITVNSWFITDDNSTKPFDSELEGTRIKLNESSETCIYEVVATYNSQPNYNGVVRHSFAVKSKQHQYGEWETQKESTCSEEGIMVRTCECGAQQTKPIEMISHTYGEWKVTQESTCAEEGTETRSCKNCGNKDNRSIEKLEHKWQDANCERPKTCADCGTTTGDPIHDFISSSFNCILCGKKVSTTNFIHFAETDFHDILVEYPTAKATSATMLLYNSSNGDVCVMVKVNFVTGNRDLATTYLHNLTGTNRVKNPSLYYSSIGKNAIDKDDLLGSLATVNENMKLSQECLDIEKNIENNPNAVTTSLSHLNS